MMCVIGPVGCCAVQMFYLEQGLHCREYVELSGVGMLLWAVGRAAAFSALSCFVVSCSAVSVVVSWQRPGSCSTQQRVLRPRRTVLRWTSCLGPKSGLGGSLEDGLGGGRSVGSLSQRGEVAAYVRADIGCTAC